MNMAAFTGSTMTDDESISPNSNLANNSECVFAQALQSSTYIDHLHPFPRRPLIAGINPHLLMTDRGDYMCTYAMFSLLHCPGIVHHALLFF